MVEVGVSVISVVWVEVEDGGTLEELARKAFDKLTPDDTYAGILGFTFPGVDDFYYDDDFYEGAYQDIVKSNPKILGQWLDTEEDEE